MSDKYTQLIGETPEVVINGMFIKVITPVQEVEDDQYKHLNTLLLIVDRKYWGTMLKLTPESPWVVMKRYHQSKKWREVGFPRRVPPQKVIDLVESVFYATNGKDSDGQRGTGTTDNSDLSTTSVDVDQGGDEVHNSVH